MRVIVNQNERDLEGRLLLYHNPNQTIEIDRRGIRSLSKYAPYIPNPPDEVVIEETETSVRIWIDGQRFAWLDHYKKEWR